MAITQLFSRLSSEAGIIFDSYRLFGIRKALIFTINLPLIWSRDMNRIGYEAMGRSKLKIEGKELVFVHLDIPFINEIIVQRSYDGKPGFEISDGDVVLDLGANVGVFSLYSALKNPNGRIVSVEPETTNFRFLLENVKANNFTNVVCEKLAISNSCGKTWLYLDKPGSNSLMQPSQGQKVQECESTTIEYLMEKNRIRKVDFLKMDIEGAEYKVFESIEWLSSVKRIAIEMHPVCDSGLIVDRLKENGFSVEVTKNPRSGETYCYALHD